MGSILLNTKSSTNAFSAIYLYNVFFNRLFGRQDGKPNTDPLIISTNIGSDPYHYCGPINFIQVNMTEVQFELGFGLFELVSITINIIESTFENIGHDFNYLTIIDTLSLTNRVFNGLKNPIIFIYMVVVDVTQHGTTMTTGN